MNTVSITTPQNIDVEFELASLGERMVGYVIDYLIQLGLVVAIAMAVGFTNLGRIFDGNSWLLLVVILPILLYDLLSEIFLNGQTVGKKIMSIRVISLTGTAPTIGQYIIRWLFRLVDFLLTTNVLALVMVAVMPKKQRLGDVVAHTILIKTVPRPQFEQTLYTPIVQNDYKPVYTEVVMLRDNDVQLIKEVLQAVNRTGNTMIALHAQQKVEQALSIMSRHSDPISFLHTVLADYNYLTARL